MNTTEFCQRTHATRDTLRFYDTIGILTPDRRSNNYRDYSEDDLVTYQIIQNLKVADVSLTEIAQILTLRTRPVTVSCRDDVLTIVQEKTTQFAKQQQFYSQLLQITTQMCTTLQTNHQEQLMALIEQLGGIGDPTVSDRT
ncbi:MerR family transcriptional regulator [Levilactobacillus tujiorum]|uniref:MerR family transcriptional regulator n=1 Tax=Levilactobacillus tujiorum TaxID=2912243 RepID=UPI001456AEED|nr:MerR family transcriptional regulator [Levilactobacillus tujiorum]NLR32430.1 MerR family transcriptional regulator [Levilactobacillus tujiorum]